MTDKLTTRCPIACDTAAPRDLLRKGTNGAACPLTSPPCRSSVNDTLARFEREAEPGVCDTGRYRCSYYVWGKGPPLLFVPGMGDNSRSFVFLAAELAEHFRCIAYDYPTGCGDGARLGRYTHADLVADLFAVLDHLRVERCYVLGSSFGSTVTLAALQQQPARFPRAVLQGGFARRPLSAAERLTARLGRVWPGKLARFPLYPRLFRYNHSAGFASRPEERWQYCLARIGQRRTRVMARYALLLHRVDARPLLPHIRQPVLLVTGDCDPLVKQPCTDELLHGLPNAAHVEIDGCGHLPLFSHPAELAQIVFTFLTPLSAVV
jgi:pimeloyl-ACP methyl ester carboxylesterase